MGPAAVTIESLPVELFSAILTNIPSYVDDKRDLRSCSLVSRAFRHFALPLLFASITVIICRTDLPAPAWMAEVGLDHVLDFIRRMPHLAAHVRALRLTTMRPIYPQSDWFAPYIAVSLDPDALTTCLLGFPALRTFHTVGIAVLHPPSPGFAGIGPRQMDQVLINVRLHPSAQAAYQRAGYAGVDEPMDVSPLLAVFRGTSIRELRLSGPIDFQLFFDTEKNLALQKLNITTLDLSHPRIRIDSDIPVLPAVSTLRTLQLGLDSLGEFEAIGAIAPQLFPELTHLVCRAAVMAYNFSPLPPPPDFSELPSLSRITLRDIVVDGDSITKVAVMLRHFAAPHARAPLRAVHLDLVSGYVYSAREPAQVALAVNELEAVLLLLHARRRLEDVSFSLDVSAWADTGKAAKFESELFAKLKKDGVRVVKTTAGQ
ncbi:hypothetical protein EIP86_009371 [Pleurotus ostreatoroseus]|nr:hypothetical protein EIP86_009371 [Pleurotus ostreatoroseus]